MDYISAAGGSSNPPNADGNACLNQATFDIPSHTQTTPLEGPERFDLTGELVTGFTEQDSEEDSLEATVRLGALLHLLGQIINNPYFKQIRPGRITGTRLNIANLARFEYRNFWYKRRPTLDG